MKTTIGIVGNGVVGRATAACWRDRGYEVRVHDIEPRKSYHTLQGAVNCDVVMLCLPTPASREGGLDLSALDKSIEQIMKCRGYLSPTKTFLIRSTVPVHTTRNLRKATGMNLMHYPEFLTTRTATHDAWNPKRVILGTCNPSAFPNPFKALLTEQFPNAHHEVVSAETSELIKLADNAWAATKITFFNQLKMLSETIGISWDDVRTGLLCGDRINPEHTQVPGPDGTLGYGGHCLPKDTDALLAQSDELDCSFTLLEEVSNINARIRGEK